MVAVDFFLDDDLVQGIMGNDPSVQDHCTIQIRRLLSIEKNPPIQKVIDAGLVPRFIEFLQRGDSPDLQYEAAWALTNIVSGTNDNTRVVIDCGAVPILVDLISSPYDNVREQVIWALSNIAGDSPSFRDVVLESDAMGPLLDQLKGQPKLAAQRTFAFALSNFCRHKPRPKLEIMKMALPSIVELISIRDEDASCDACFALSYIIGAFAGNGAEFQNIIKYNILPTLINFLSNDSWHFQNAAIQVFSSMMAADRDQIQTVIESNIVVPELIRFMGNLTSKNGVPKLRKDATQAITNAISYGSYDQIKILVDQGCIRCFCDLLKLDRRDSYKTVRLALDGLESILRVGEKDANKMGYSHNEMFLLLMEVDGLMRLQSLRNHPCKEICQKANAVFLENLFMLISTR